MEIKLHRRIDKTPNTHISKKKKKTDCVIEKSEIDCFHDPIMQHVLGGSLHKNNTSCLLLGLYHASVNSLSIVLMQIPPQNELYYGIGEKSE